MDKYNDSKRWNWRTPGIFLLITFITGCAFYAGKHLDERFGLEAPRERMVAADSSQGDFYHHEVKPIIENRCIVCHGCYDAPCQLKLSSPQGIDRGASKNVVYNGARLRAAPQSRLFEDAMSTSQWREQSFYPVLNERNQDVSNNLEASILYKSLDLKKQHPLPDDAILNKSFDLRLDRKQQCPTLSEWESFSTKKPLWGMPYGLPGLNETEFSIFKSWLQTGSKMADKPDLDSQYLAEIAKWESFLNGETKKHQLMARYIYEHWFLAHLYFKQLSNGEFFRLVRSRTPPGEPINRISTRRPYDDPGVDNVYYRFWREKGTIISKTHMPYALDDARLIWIDELFLQEDYLVEELPSHHRDVAGNPFIAFEAIPVSTRWRFLIEEAQFTIMNFIKGPVCRGQVALNVINDHFWVFFINPEFVAEDEKDIEDFYAENKEHLRMPNEEESNVRPLKTWRHYSKLQKQYLTAKTAWLKKNSRPNLLTLDLIWDGHGENENAALTIFRHFDSASVVKGAVGQAPKTAWLIGYSLLERIHYLLVAGYDVYGNLGHQLTTRLYMDFLRMEGEANFLTLIPEQDREKIRDQWYQNASQDVKEHVYGEHTNFYKETGITYQTADVKSELFEKIKERLDPVISRKYDLDNSAMPPEQVQHLNRLNQQQGLFASLLPQTTFLTVLNDDKPHYYTLIHNNVHSNITSLFSEKSNRQPEQDYLTVVKGFMGDYPGAFWQVETNNLNSLVDDVLSLSSVSDYKTLMDNYGVRRTDKQFWKKSDELHQANYELNPVEAGLFDFNRLENR